MDMQVLDTRRDSSGGYKVDVSRGSRVGRVSSEWFSRPDDERFLSLGDLARSVRGRSDRSRTRVVETALIHVEANRNDPERLALMLPGAEAPVTPTHWSFGQLASQVGAPAAYLRQLPAPLAAINLQYGLTSHRAEQIKTLETDDPVSGGRLELRAVTGPDYGRIYDHELVEAVQKIAGNGTGDTRWKVPGVLDWSTGVYNPNVDISKDTTTLYASDRDVFGWLRPGEMADGLGLAETTPGPLILVTQFVGYLAAFRAPEPFSPFVAGLLGAGLTTWVTFAPCFLWIFALAPWIDRLGNAVRLKGGLAAVTAAVVGVIANLTAWFALHVLFAEVGQRQFGPLRLYWPDPASFDWRAGVLAAIACALVFGLKWSVLRVLMAAALGGMVLVLAI